MAPTYGMTRRINNGSGFSISNRVYRLNRRKEANPIKNNFVKDSYCCCISMAKPKSLAITLFIFNRLFDITGGGRCIIKLRYH